MRDTCPQMTAPDLPTTPVRDAPRGAASASLLAEITAELAAGNDLHDLLGHFLPPIMRIAGAQAGAVRVLDAGERRMLMIGSLGLPPSVLDAERSVAQDCGACGAAARRDRPVWADDLSVCTQRDHSGYFGVDCRRVLAVPLHHRGRLLGIYNLFFRQGEEPSAEVLALLKSIGDLLGLALHNAQLERENLRATVANERQMMAAEVHDAVAQSLAFVKMRLPLLHDAMLAHDDARSLRYYDDVRRAVADAHTSLREILADFRTRVDPEGLLHALRKAVAAFEPRTGITLELVDRVGVLALAPERQAQAFHVVQEALSNVARHSLARHARLSVELSDGDVHLRVEDDGTGFVDAAGAHASAHYGIDIMRARARRLGGTLALRPRAGGGTCVHLVFPLHPGPAARVVAAPGP